MGLSLKLSSPTNKKTSVLLASYGHTLITLNRFSSKFSNVIMPWRVTELETAPGWVIQESSIAMNGYILTEIHAVCYKSTLQVNPSARGPLEYHAILGHITVKTPLQKSDFPPSASWLVESQYIKWTSGSQGSKTLSIKILWSLKDGNVPIFSKYNIYVEKQSGGLNGKPEYLGVANVRAFYVSELSVPSGTSSLKFVIQVCGLDGVCQKLDDSPAYQVPVEGV